MTYPHVEHAHRQLAAVGFEGVNVQDRPHQTWERVESSGRADWWRSDVFFAHTCDSEWLVKIGATGDVRRRVGTLRAPSGARCELRAVIPVVGSIAEQWLHWYFDGLRVTGEFFTPWPPLLELIERVNRVFPLDEATAA